MGSTKLRVAAEAKKLAEIRKTLNTLYDEFTEVPGFYRSDFGDLAAGIDKIQDAIQHLTKVIRFANRHKTL